MTAPLWHRRSVATALWIAAATWLVATLVIFYCDRQAEALLAELSANDFANATPVIERTVTLGILANLTDAIAILVVVAVAGQWATSGDRGAVLVRVGQALAVLAVLATVVPAVLETIDEGSSASPWFHVAPAAARYLGLVALAAPLRVSIALRAAFGIGTVAWVAILVAAAVDPDRGAASTIERAIPWVLQASWAVLAMLAAGKYADLEAERAANRTSDAARASASIALVWLRMAFIGRVVLAVVVVGVLLSLRATPGVMATGVWAFAVVQCIVACGLVFALARYGRLPDEAVGRGSVGLAIVCVVAGGALELMSAHETAKLADWAAQAQLPPMADAAAIQQRLQWIGRGSALVGITAMVSLATTLRRTALWLDDPASIGRASGLMAATVLAGGGAATAMHLVQSGAVRGTGSMVALAAGVLAVALAIMVQWLRLLAGLAHALGRR